MRSAGVDLLISELGEPAPASREIAKGARKRQPEKAESTVRKSGLGRAGLLALFAIVSVASGAVAAADLSIVNTTTFTSGGKKYLQPCVRNSSNAPKQAYVRIGNGVMKWAYPPLPVGAGETKCFAFDAPPLHAGVEQHHIDVTAER